MMNRNNKGREDIKQHRMGRSMKSNNTKVRRNKGRDRK
jgi:hypothetical protein